ncbi:putative Ig domain-containing protein [Actinoplanes sp. NPDC051470]|uniref:putative Ig domain-containing protein n=1 Tax=Actinoplanes sp. NPDC051470 TaxID=3157224 RepID=UPI003414C694
MLDGGFNLATRTFSLIVNRPLSPVSTVPAAAIGTPYATTLGPSPAAPLPAGLRLAADSGAITGIPTGPAGASPVTLTVTDAAGATAMLTLTLTLTVNPAAPAARPQGPPPGLWVQPVIVVVLGLNGAYPITPPAEQAGGRRSSYTENARSDVPEELTRLRDIPTQ